MQQVDPRHLSDFEPGLGDLIQFVRIRIVLPGYFQVDLADQQVEVVQDRRRSDILPVAYQFLLGLLIFTGSIFCSHLIRLNPKIGCSSVIDTGSER